MQERIGNKLWKNFVFNSIEYFKKHKISINNKDYLESCCESPEKITEFAENIPCPFVIFDKNGTEIYYNPVYEKIFQFLDRVSFRKEFEASLNFIRNSIDDLFGNRSSEVKFVLQWNELSYSLEVSSFVGILGKGDDPLLGCIIYINPTIMEKIKRLIELYDVFKIVLERIPYFVMIEDAYGRIIKTNRNVEEFLHFSPAELEGKFISTIFPVEIAESFSEAINEVIRTKKPKLKSIEKLLINGASSKDFRIDRIPIIDEGEEIIGIICVIIDITEERKAEEEIRAWKQRFELVTTSLGQAVFERDWETEELVWTRNIEVLTGYRIEELSVRNKWISIVHPDDVEQYLKTFNKYCEMLAPYEMTYRIVSADGKIKWVKEYGFFLTEGDRVISILGVIIDITSQKSLEQKLNDYNTFLHVLLDTIPMPIFFENIEGKLIGSNKAFEETILKMGKRDFLGRFIQEFEEVFSEEFCRWHRETSKKILNNEKFDTYDAIINTPDLGERVYAVYKAGYKDFDGNLAGIINILIDITDRKKAEEELKQLNLELERKVEERTRDLQVALEEYKFEAAEHRRIQEILEQANYELKILNEALSQESQKLLEANEKLKKSEQELLEANSAKDKFFTIIAHDIKNPVQSIITDAEILFRFFHTFTPEKLRDYINHIYRTSNLLKDLLESLLTWAKAQAKRITFKPEWVSLDLVLIDVLKFIEPIAKAKQVQIHYECKIENLVCIDRNLITTVVRNLLTNAIKYSHRGSNVYFVAENYNGGSIPSFAIIVRDEGIGIPKEKLEKLFKIEYNVSTPGTEREQGTGLGLILCKELVELHGGKIQVESEVNKGSTFRIIIPFSVD